MKLRAPANCMAISLDGRALAISEDGSVEVDEAAWTPLAAHGFSPWSAHPLRADQSEARPAGHNSPASLVDLLQFGTAKTQTVRKACSDATKGLDRSALFALLRERRIPVRIPITNEQLRALADQS